MYVLQTYPICESTAKKKTFSGEHRCWGMDLCADYESSQILIELMSFLVQIFHKI
jgi:hypothetical protein